MAPFQNLMEIFKLLEKTNCRKCNEATCLAFAGAVFKGEKPLSDCPLIDAQILKKYGSKVKRTSDGEKELAKAMHALKSQITMLDFNETAKRISALHENGKLTLKVMGKDFSVDKDGRLYSDIHVNPWITIPLLTYVTKCKGTPIKHEWMPLRELPGGLDRYRLFSQRCEKPLKKLADTYTDLFEDLITIFNGKPAEKKFKSDIAIILSPLPLIPMLICYWKPEEGMESNLNLFFDATAADNLGADGLFSLGTGIVQMFEKIALRHGMENYKNGEL